LNYNDLSIITLKELNFAVVFIQFFRGFRGKKKFTRKSQDKNETIVID